MFNPLAATNNFLANLSNLEQRLGTAQNQVSSGLKMQTISDSPDQVSVLLEVKAQIARNDQLKANLGHVQTEVNAAESAINQATSLMDKARQIATEANTSMVGASTRSQLADQVKEIINEVIALTNTSVEGRYVFSGNSDQVAPYKGVDLTQANAVGVYQGNSATRVVEHPNGTTFSISLTADQVFDGNFDVNGNASNSVLRSLTTLYNDLTNNNTNNLSADDSNIMSASSYLAGQQAQYGLFQNQVSDAITFQQALNTQLQGHLSTLQDADAVLAATTMQQDSTEVQAALQVQAAMPRKSLFDFIG